MATIQKIRKHYGLVIIFIGIAMFAFILMDVMQDGVAFRGGSPDTAGEISGEKISYSEFEMLLQRSVSDFRMQNEKGSLGEEEMHQLNEQTWNQLVIERVMLDEYKEMGFTVTSDEIMYFSVDDPHPGIRNAFTNPETGQFDRDAVLNFFRNLRDNPEGYTSWMAFERSLVEERQRRKYYELLRKSSFITDLEAKNNFVNRNRTAEIQYVALNLNEIPDTAITFSERDLKRYYRENREDYKVEEERSLEYVSWEIAPSPEDTISVIQFLENRKEEFRNTVNDSLFLRRHSERPWDPTYYSRGNFTEELENQVFDADSGDVIGPVYENESYFLIKVTGFSEDTMQYFNANHILIKPKGNTRADSLEAMSNARNILNRIRGGADFEEMAREHSEDHSNAPAGGYLGWFGEGMMVKPFEDAVKRLRRDEMTVVQSEFGAHIIRLNQQPTRATVQMALLQRSVSPTQRTHQEVYSQASRFLNDARDEESFRAAASRMNLNRRTLPEVKPFDRSFAGLPNARDLVRWAYTNNRGEISNIIEIDNRYIVAYLSQVQEEGYAPFEKVREEVETAYINHKKKEELENRLREANRNTNTLAEVAANAGTETQVARNITFANTIIPQLGDEPKLVGSVFGLQENLISFPVTGNNGVYQIVVQTFIEPAAPDNYNEQKNTMLSDLEARSQFQTLEALKDRANVKDYRYKFY